MILVHRVLVAACNHSPSREYEQSPAKTSFERIVAKRRRTLTHKSTRHAAPTSKKRLTQAPYEELTHSNQDAVSRRRTSGETTSPATAADVSILSTADQTTRHSHWHDPQSKQSPNLAFDSGRGTKGASSRCPPFNKKTAQHSRTRQGRPPIPSKPQPAPETLEDNGERRRGVLRCGTALFSRRTRRSKLRPRRAVLASVCVCLGIKTQPGGGIACLYAW